MAEGISAVLTYAIGVAISPVPIIAVILMLFSARARVNGPLFLAGWVVALAVVSAVVYIASDASDAATDSTDERHDLVGEDRFRRSVPPARRTPVAESPGAGSRS